MKVYPFICFKEVDLIGTSLTINARRATVIDFTTAYWEERSAVLLRKPEDLGLALAMFKIFRYVLYRHLIPAPVDRMFAHK